MRSVFSDAQAMLENARFHRKRYNSEYRNPWDVKELREGEVYHYDLVLNTEQLARVRPIISDIANNLVHSLDLLLSACIRHSSPARTRGEYFPLKASFEEFKALLEKNQQLIGENFVNALIDTRRDFQNAQDMLSIVKDISNTTKHWKLVPVSADALAVAVHFTGRQNITDIAPDYFKTNSRLRFYSSKERVTKPVSMVVGSKLEIGGDEIRANPDSAFDWTERYVEKSIAACESLVGQQA